MEAKRRLASVVALILVNAVVMGCGVQPSTPSRTSAAEAPTATATGTPSPAPQPTVAPALLARCDAQQTAPATVNQAGDVLIFKPTAPLNNPAVRLPDQTPLKPLQVLTQNSNNAFKSSAVCRYDSGQSRRTYRLHAPLFLRCNHLQRLRFAITCREERLGPYRQPHPLRWTTHHLARV
jgi:hypothetical protein